MKRILLKISYNGTRYAGWQRQNEALTVQQVIEDAISGFQGVDTVIYASGRTDAGVHAFCQVAHFDPVMDVPASKWEVIINNRLPEDIRIIKSRTVDLDFHARYDATRKTYKYVFYNSSVASAVYYDHCFFVPYNLDFEKMNDSLKSLLGEHDFFAFMAAGCNKAITTRTIYDVGLIKKDDIIELTITGSGFLRNMVRIIAGTLIDIGRGKLPSDSFTLAIEKKDRNLLGDTAASCGLYLMDVKYEGKLKEI